MNYLHYNHPELYAQDILTALNLTIPIDVYKICEFYDIKINYEDVDAAEAFLIVCNGKKNIVINRKKILYKPRERFTIAHEIGHYIIPWHNSLHKCLNIGDFDSTNIIENEADIFASELLMPTNEIQQKIIGRDVNLDLIKELAQEFNVSLGAMTRKIIKNTNEKVIVLLYYDDGTKIIQAQTSSFHLNLKEGIIRGSAAKELLQNGHANETIKRILSSDVWFKDNNNINIVEESLYQPKLSRVFTLLRIAKDTDYLDIYIDT